MNIYYTTGDDFSLPQFPDHPQRLDAAIRWVTDHGFKPIFFHEGFLGGRE